MGEGEEMGLSGERGLGVRGERVSVVGFVGRLFVCNNMISVRV